jgi:hypothetical protein
MLTLCTGKFENVSPSPQETINQLGDLIKETLIKIDV